MGANQQCRDVTPQAGCSFHLEEIIQILEAKISLTTLVRQVYVDRLQCPPVPGEVSVVASVLPDSTSRTGALDEPSEPANGTTLLRGIEEGLYSQQYGRDELGAEISSVMIGDRLQIGHDPARSSTFVYH